MSPERPRPDEGARIRVVHSSPVWLPRTQTWMHSQACALPVEVESHIVCQRTANLDVFAMDNIHCLTHGPRWRIAQDKVLRALRVRRHVGSLVGAARRIQADVVHSHFGHVGWRNLAALRRLDAAHVVTFYGQDVGYLPRRDPRWRKQYRAMFAEVDRVLCEGPHMARCIAELGCPEGKVRVQHLGVDLERLPFVPRHKAPGEPLRVLMAASFTEKKGIPDGLQALARIHGAVDLRVTLIGDANGDSRNQAEKRRIHGVLEEHTALRERVRLLGYQSHAALIEQAYGHHVFLSPSVHAADGDTEGGAPVSILEMAATGLPIVSTTHCDIPEVVAPGRSALLSEEHDVEGLAGHLLQLARHPETWADMGRAGRAHVEAQFDLAAQGRALARQYREVVASSRGG